MRLLCLLCLLSVTTIARAEPSQRFALHWSRAPGAESCIDPRALSRRVEELTGPAFVAPGEAEVTLESSVQPHRRGFRVYVFRVGADGAHSAARVLTSEARDCRKLDALVAFVLALAVDPSLSLSGLPPELLALFAEETPPAERLLQALDSEPARAEPVRPVEKAPVLPPASVPAKPAADRAQYALSLAAAAQLVTLPAALYGAQAGFTLDLPRVFPLLLSVRGFAWSESQPVTGDANARFRQADGALAVCPLGLLWGRLRVRGCAGLSLGRLSAQGRGFDKDRDAKLWDAAALASLALWLRLTRHWGLLAEASGRLRFLDNDFEFVAESGQRSSSVAPAPLGVGLALGPIYEF